MYHGYKHIDVSITKFEYCLKFLDVRGSGVIPVGTLWTRQKEFWGKIFYFVRERRIFLCIQVKMKICWLMTKNRKNS